MFDTFIEGPDATRLLATVSANNYENFAVGQAKQFIPVTQRRQHRHRRHPAAHRRADVHAQRRPGRAELGQVPRREGRLRRAFAPTRERVPRRRRPGAVPLPGPGPAGARAGRDGLRRPAAGDEVLPLHPGRPRRQRFRALRHGMAGQAGFEFIGAWRDAAAVKDALLSAGEPFGLVHVGALAYPTPAWRAAGSPRRSRPSTPTPDLADYRASLPLFCFEGQKPLNGQLLLRRHRGLLRLALRARLRPLDLLQPRLHRPRRPASRPRTTSPRTKVTLVFDPADVRRVLGDDHGYYLTYAGTGSRRRRRARRAHPPDGHHRPGGHGPGAGADRQAARRAGHRGDGRLGRAPRPGTAPDADLGFPRIRATVAPAPYDAYAATQYRRH